MLKPLPTTFAGRQITLECTHKKQFPPPRVYTATPEDIDIMWRQGSLTPTEHQQLQVWKNNCGLHVMGPRCLDCPLALKQNPRPGRPHVIETESWLKARKRILAEDMAKNKTVIDTEPVLDFVQEGDDLVLVGDVIPESPLEEESSPETEPENPEEQDPEPFPVEKEEDLSPSSSEDLDDRLLEALAEE